MIYTIEFSLKDILDEATAKKYPMYWVGVDFVNKESFMSIVASEHMKPGQLMWIDATQYSQLTGVTDKIFIDPMV